MSNVKFDLNLKGLNELMRSPEMQNCLREAGEAVAQGAGEGFEVDVHNADFAAVCYVDAKSEEAVKESFKNNTLLKALSSSGLPMTKK